MMAVDYSPDQDYENKNQQAKLLTIASCNAQMLECLLQQQQILLILGRGGGYHPVALVKGDVELEDEKKRVAAYELEELISMFSKEEKSKIEKKFNKLTTNEQKDFLRKMKTDLVNYEENKLKFITGPCIAGFCTVSISVCGYYASFEKSYNDSKARISIILSIFLCIVMMFMAVSSAVCLHYLGKKRLLYAYESKLSEYANSATERGSGWSQYFTVPSNPASVVDSGILPVPSSIEQMQQGGGISASIESKHAPTTLTKAGGGSASELPIVDNQSNKPEDVDRIPSQQVSDVTLDVSVQHLPTLDKK